MPNDHGLAVISNLSDNHFSFQGLRSRLMADNHMKDSLEFGHAIIQNPQQLDQYWYTYGPMIESQWINVTPIFSELEPPTRWIDYGCGQGWAGLLLHDHFPDDPFAGVGEVILIEPSAVALARAQATYRRLAPHASVSAICKRFDDVRDSDLPAGPAESTIHLFSNSLDVTGFEPLALISRSLHPGRHTILAVSHDRDFNGGTPQIEAAKAAFENPNLAPEIVVSRSDLRRFVCSNPNRSRGVMWICELEVADG